MALVTEELKGLLQGMLREATMQLTKNIKEGKLIDEGLFRLVVGGDVPKNKNQSKEKNPNWKGGKSLEVYASGWTKELREKIKKRDSYQCQNPSCSRESTLLNVHHVDYNKENIEGLNLVTLCAVCNSLANANRDYWKALYQGILNAR